MSPWLSADFARRQPAVLELGREILARSAGSLPSLFDVRHWEGRLLDLAMRDDALRTALFRLVDVLPMLAGEAKVARHVREYLGAHEAALPAPVALALRAAKSGILAGVAGRSIRPMAIRMGERFIVGSSTAEAMPELRRMYSRGLTFSADLLGEATVSDAEAAAYAGRYEALIGMLSEETAHWPEKEAPPGADRPPLPPASISLKISSLSAHLDPIDCAGCVARLFERVLPLFLQARERNVRIPAQVLHFLPGRGEVAGQHLVGHPGVATIAFTGSRAVGLAILAKAGRTAPGQPEVKRVVCEMGGKNAIIVDDDADLDEAVAGVIRSAFGYAGQKCSACSRLITVGAASGAFTARLIEACRSLVMAPPEEPRCELGPVIDADAYERLTAVMDDPGAEPLFIGKAPGEGFFVPPAVYRAADLRHRLMQEELFGPVLALFEASDFEAALEAAGSTDYALTGGVYSRSPAHLAEARRRFRVGNLYLNRPCTGAMVGRQPFGGFGMSGTGTKAGGAGYLLHFCNPSVVCENTMRSGFVPEGEGSSGDMAGGG